MKTPVQCIIVDDEPIAGDILAAYLQRLEGYEVVGKYTNPLRAFEAVTAQPPDLLFLDIQMPGLTGLELIKVLNPCPQVILTTAYREFALDGFDLDVLDYLLKPISFDRFLVALGKFQARAAIVRTATPATQAEAPVLVVRADRKTVRVNLADILYLESMKDYVKIVCREGQVVTKDTISNLEEKLPVADFLRVHRSFVVARNKVTAQSVDGLEIGKTLIPVGRQYKEVVKEWWQ